MPWYECPTCGKMLTVPRRDDAPYRPFCSERCKMIDLGRWFAGDYRISEPATPEALDHARTEQDDLGTDA